MELTPKQVKQMRKDARRAMKSVREGMTVQEAAAELYVRATPGAEMDAGLAIAQRVERMVAEYELMREGARRDPEGWIDRKLDEMGEGLDCAQRCAALMGLLGRLLALQKDEEAPQEEFDETQASEAMETELRGCIRQALACATLGATEMECLEQAMQQLGGEETRRLVDFGAQEHDVCVLEGMLGYIAARDGGEAEVTPEEMAVSVCLAQDAKRVLMDAEEGTLTEEEAARTMALVGRAAHLLLAHGAGGAVSLAVNAALFPVCPTFVRKPVALAVGNLVSLAVEYTAEPLVESAVSGGWRVVERSDAAWARRLRQICHEQQENIIPQCEQGLDILEHPVASLRERIRSGVVRSSETVDA